MECSTRKARADGQLRDDPLLELVSGIGQREGDMRVQALQPAWVARASDPKLERRAAVTVGAAGGELAADCTLLLRPILEAAGQVGVLLNPCAPALHAACRLEPRHRCDQVAAGQVVGGRERLALVVVRLLLGDGRPAEGAADGYAPEGTRRPAQLARDDLAVIHYSEAYVRARGARG